MTPGHRAVQEMLGAHALGRLDDAGTAQLRAHLDGCARCRAELASLEPVVRALGSVDPAGVDTPAAAPPDLLDRIVDAVRAESAATADPFSAPVTRRVRHANLRRQAVAVAVAAALAAAFGAGSLVGVRTRAEPPAVAAPPVEAVVVSPTVEGVRAEAGLVTHTWGTEVVLEVAGLDAGTYRVTVQRDDGSVVDAGTFLGTGPGTVTCRLMAAVPRSAAVEVSVTDATGEVVVTADTTQA